MIDRGSAVGEAPLSRAAILEAQLGASVEGSLVVSADGRILSWNSRFLEIWKLAPDFLELGSHETVQRALEPFLAEPRRYRDRLAYLADHPEELSRDEVRLRDGRILDRHTAPLIGETGEVVGRMWFFRDVTEDRRRGEDAIRARDDRLELALAASRTGFWEWDLATGKLDWSDQVSAIHGLPPGHAPVGFNQYANEMIHPDDRERFLSTVTEAVDAGGQYDLEFRVLWPDGSVHWMNGVGRAFVDATGRPIRMIGIGRDITDRKREEEEREASSQIREAFIGVLSHELRTPITTIYGGVKVLRRRGESLDPESRAAVLDDIDSEADRLFRLVEDLLVLTRAERGNLEVGDEPVHLLPIIDRVIVAAGTTWPGIGFKCDRSGRLPVVRGDDTYVEQVLRNLVGNAGKYSPDGTTVEIETKVVDGAIEVKILDRGPGIDEANAERLFDLFYRASATAHAASGAGIGLFVARRLIEAMNGGVWARPRPGGGSEFGFSLLIYDEK